MARSGSLLVPGQDLAILDFDIETRLVGFHSAGRFKPSGSEPISLAASFNNVDDVWVWLQPEDTVEDILEALLDLWNTADIVTGHYLRKFDIPILNGALLEHGFPLLGPKLVSDTKTDLVDFEGMSKSQENLSEMLALYEEKYHMNDVRWRKATRLTPEGIELTRERVAGDVVQHQELRLALVKAGALKPPTLWTP